MKGLIIVNAYSKLEHGLNQAYRLKSEFEARSIKVDIVQNDKFFAYIEGKKLVCDVKDYNFCIYLDKDKYISKLLELSGLRLFDTHESIRLCDDKFETYTALCGNDIMMPLTLSGLLCYDAKEEIRLSTVERIENKLTYPIVVKLSYGSLGEGVFLARNREELTEIMCKLKTEPHLFQQYFESSRGRDVRVIVIGGKAVASMLRENDCDFRSNIERGGRGTPFVLPESFKKASEKVAEILGLDYCGVDLLFGCDGEPVLCEVNSNAFFGGIESVTKINVAAMYCEHIIKSI